MAVRRIGVLGGTFDPIHNDHLLMAHAVLHRLGLDQVLFVPVGLASHRSVSADPAARCDMVNLAVRATGRFALSSVDVDRAGPTYTADTMRELREDHGDAELYLIVGADNLAALPNWRGAAEIVSHATIVGCPRAGYPLRNPGIPGQRLTLLPIPRLGISATAIRKRRGEGRSLTGLTPDAVASYIDQEALYEDAPKAD